MTFLMHWSFKTGYHEIAAKKFLATGAPFPECKSWKRFHAPGSVEGWILVEADNADACYEHAAEWAECLDWEVTPVLTDEQAGPLIAKAYSRSSVWVDASRLFGGLVTPWDQFRNFFVRLELFGRPLMDSNHRPTA